jgi:hypothetical protein
LRLFAEVADLGLISIAEAGRRMEKDPRTARKILVASGLRLVTSGSREYVADRDVELLIRSQLTAEELNRA